MKPIFDAVIFDLDGVITNTAKVHSLAWKDTFDEFLLKYSKNEDTVFKEFTHENDYLPFVDGKPRYKGVQSFLESRGIYMEYGSPDDSIEKNTICGIGNRKNFSFNKILEKEGVEVYSSTVNLVNNLRKLGVRVGVASSSKNCKVVLEAAKIDHLFEVRIDGIASVELGLNGKPEPDIFRVACDVLQSKYSNSVVVEDAVSGVQAGRKGGFGLVLGIAREDNIAELYQNGADYVVNDLKEIDIDFIQNWFINEIEKKNWEITYYKFDKKLEKHREALTLTGNGYFGTRGADENYKASESHYPATYIAGLYNRLKSQVGDKEIENEDFVNCPNWIAVNVMLKNTKLNRENFAQTGYLHTLNLKSGETVREVNYSLKNNSGICTSSSRFASMKNPHLAIQKYIIESKNYSGNIKVEAGIDGDIINEGVERYKSLNQKHLKPVLEKIDGNRVYVEVETVQSGIKISEEAVIILRKNGEIVTNFDSKKNSSQAFHVYDIEIENGDVLEVEKLVCIKATHQTETEEEFLNAHKTLDDFQKKIINYNDLVEQNKEAWKSIWNEIDIQIDGDRYSQKLLRLHAYHLISSASLNNIKLDAGLTARGLHGEAYRGHVFWDELYILPFYYLHYPEVAKSLLMYRFRRIEEAKKYAKMHGYKGAMFPWQSGSDGREETQILHLNPITGKWGDDNSSLQRHVSLAIAYNVVQYFNLSKDFEFMLNEGASLLFEICKFWASTISFDEETKRYSITKVMGPDEFHEKMPDSEKGGLSDNAYTNIMVSWLFLKAHTIWNKFTKIEQSNIKAKTGISDNEISNWIKIANAMNLIVSDEGIIAQFDGYFDLKELDWDAYRAKYGNIYRMDRILKSEGKSADQYKVAKQADTLMIFYNLEKELVSNIIKMMDYHLPSDFIEKNLHYYLDRTSHGSTLSRLVHSHLAKLVDNHDLSWELYSQALESDFSDIQGGTTAEGVHSGMMAGTYLGALTNFAGIDFRGNILKINPALPKHWKKMSFNFKFRSRRYKVELNNVKVRIKLSDCEKTAKAEIFGEEVSLQPSEYLEFYKK